MCVIPKLPDHKNHRERLCRRAKHILERAKETLGAAGLPVRTMVRTGSPVRVVIGASYNYDVTVVAAASRRVGPMAGLGPVGARVAEHSHRATILAREGRAEPGARILVAVDGSEGSLRALDTMLKLVDLSAAEVTLLHVVETPWLLSALDQEWPSLGDEESSADLQAQMKDALLQDADDILSAASEHLPAHVTLNSLIYEGVPADEILGEADRGDYDLLAIGATGATDLKHQILGSVSSRVAWDASCSVLLVNTEDEAEGL